MMIEIVEDVFVQFGEEGINVGAIDTYDGLICVDVPSYPRNARDWASKLVQINHKSVKWLILTDGYGDRALNARWMNAPLITQQDVADRLMSYEKKYPQSMAESLMQRNPLFAKEISLYPVVRATLSFTDKMTLLTSRGPIILEHVLGPAPGSLWVGLPEEGILFAGDSIASGMHPRLDELNIDEWIASLKRLLRKGNEAERIIPGRGGMDTDRAIEQTIEYLENLRFVVQQHILAGLPESGLAVHVDEILLLYPDDDRPDTWLRSNILYGLKRVYDQLCSSQGATMATDPLKSPLQKKLGTKRERY